MSAPLPVIHDFSAHGNDPGRYLRLPDDWWIASTDVVGSTGLAAQGRDRDVNFAAAAAVAVLSAAASRPPEPAACQFGGDGALAAVPPECRAAAEAALAALGHWAEHDIGVPLRVGLVPVRALSEAGLDAYAALHDFGNNNAFGLFIGAGIPAAESWVKADSRWRVATHPGPLPGLEGVSCRWRPVPASRGVVLCVIVEPVDPGPQGMAALTRVQAALEAIVPTQVAAPLGDGGRLVPRPVPTLHALALEVRTEPPARRPWRAVKALAGAAILAAVHRLGGRLGSLDVDAYRRACATRSDYRKQAGGPRLVLDVTRDEARRIEAMLAAAEASGGIRYGTATAAATTMTCLVGDFAADRHIHFVDGAGLGFWRASVAFKAKLHQ
ncbi:MAG: DUF3095 family protein [Magnetospirillum sp.]|nr:DUF3095 family protein [Magnetospirillum sp.]